MPMPMSAQFCHAELMSFQSYQMSEQTVQVSCQSIRRLSGDLKSGTRFNRFPGLVELISRGNLNLLIPSCRVVIILLYLIMNFIHENS